MILRAVTAGEGGTGTAFQTAEAGLLAMRDL